MAQYFNVTVGSHNPPKDSSLAIQIDCLAGCEAYDIVLMKMRIINNDTTSSIVNKHFFSTGSHFIQGETITIFVTGADVNNKTITQIYGFGKLLSTGAFDYNEAVFISNDVNSTDKRVIWVNDNTPTPTAPKLTELSASSTSVTVGTTVTITTKFDKDMTKVRLYKNNVSSTTVVGTINPTAGQRQVVFNVTENTPQTVKYIAQGEY